MSLAIDIIYDVECSRLKNFEKNEKIKFFEMLVIIVQERKQQKIMR